MTVLKSVDGGQVVLTPVRVVRLRETSKKLLVVSAAATTPVVPVGALQPEPVQRCTEFSVKLLLPLWVMLNK